MSVISSTTNTTANNNNPIILLVDDEKDILNLFCECLQRWGYQTISFDNPVDALKNFRKHNHDLIILDLKMPKMDRITLYKKIKEIDDKVIICPTTADKSLIQDLQKGITDIEKIVIYKPVLLKDLKNKIDSLLLVTDTCLKH